MLDGLKSFKLLDAAFSDNREFVRLFMNFGDEPFLELATSFRSDISLKIVLLGRFFAEKSYTENGFPDEKFIDYWLARFYSLYDDIQKFSGSFENKLHEFEQGERTLYFGDGSAKILSYTDWYVMIGCIATTEREYAVFLSSFEERYAKYVLKYRDYRERIEESKRIKVSGARPGKPIMVEAPASVRPIVNTRSKKESQEATFTGFDNGVVGFELLHSWTDRQYRIVHDILTTDHGIVECSGQTFKTVFSIGPSEEKINWRANQNQLKHFISRLADLNIIRRHKSVEAARGHFLINGNIISSAFDHGKKLEADSPAAERIDRILTEICTRLNIPMDE